MENDPAFRPLAYFSMEVGLKESIPTYSGGLGVLAGDILKSAADLGVPVVEGVTAAVKLAEGLTDLRLTTSKVRTFAPPRPKRISGWPLSAR